MFCKQWLFQSAFSCLLDYNNTLEQNAMDANMVLGVMARINTIEK